MEVPDYKGQYVKGRKEIGMFVARESKLLSN